MSALTKTISEKRLHQAFGVGLVIKAIDGFLELAGGLILLLVRPETLHGWATSLTSHELDQDPHDFIANHILHSAGKLTHHTAVFGAIYLLLHGLTKVILALSVWKNKLWAYPWMIAFLATFILYQVYEIALDGSISLTLLTTFDVVMLWLACHEYKLQMLKSVKSGGSEQPAR